MRGGGSSPCFSGRGELKHREWEGEPLVQVCTVGDSGASLSPWGAPPTQWVASARLSLRKGGRGGEVEDGTATSKE